MQYPVLTVPAIDFLNSTWEEIPEWVFYCSEEYFGGWQDYEDSYCLLIFAKGEQLYFVETASCPVYSYNTKEKFEHCIQKITIEEALKMIIEIEEVANRIVCW